MTIAEHHAASCQGKAAHRSYAEAQRANRKGGTLHPYRCGFCGLWHLGTNSRLPKAKGENHDRHP